MHAAYALFATLFAGTFLLVLYGYSTRALWTGQRLPDPPAGVPPDQRLREAIGSFSREFASTFGMVLLWPLGIGNGRAHVPSSPDTCPILVVCGYGGNRSAVWPLIGWLRHKGLGRVSGWAPPLLADPETGAAALSERIRQLSDKALGRRVDVVAFGGSALLLGPVLEADPEVMLGRCVCVAAPWRGAPMNVYWPGAGAAAMLPDRPFPRQATTALERRMAEPLSPSEGVSAEGPRWLCIRSTDDPWVPGTSGFAPESAEEIRIPLAGHLHMLHSPRVWRTLRDALRPELAREQAIEANPAAEAP
jgi:hypothetical protein